MSHIHLPDGILPFAWWASAYIMCIAVLCIMLRLIKKGEVRRKVPFTGVMSALMLISMSVPLGFIPIHMSLSVLNGILAGPALGFIAVFVVNIMLSLMGHGGLSVAGLNTLLMGSEVLIGYYMFTALKRHMKPSLAAGISALVALTVSVALMFGVLAATIGTEEALPGHESGEHGIGKEQPASFLSLSGWSAAAVILIIGMLTEALVTGLIVSFFSRVRPDLIDAPAVSESNRMG